MAGSTLSLKPDGFLGRRMGKYEVICRLSTGGMAEIFLAAQRGLAGFRKPVVLKKILPDIQGQEEFVRMFLDEAKVTAAFNHPHIAQVFDLDVDQGELFLAMEFVPGATLVEVARACRTGNEPIPLGFTLAAVRDTALALHYAHTFTDPLGRPSPVIHRDVAEKNIMVTYEGVTKLLDFGIAKNLAQDGRTQVGMVKGTSGYMSPEQILGEPLDARSDLFSLGVVLHECLTGMRLFHAKNPQAVMQAVLRAEIPEPSRTNKSVPPELDTIVLKALSRRRQERYASTLEFARELERVVGHHFWLPEQSGALMQRLFDERREQTRQLFASGRPAIDATGEVKLAQLFGENPPTPPAPTPAPPPAPPVATPPPPPAAVAAPRTPPSGQPGSPGRPLPRLTAPSFVPATGDTTHVVVPVPKASRPPDFSDETQVAPLPKVASQTQELPATPPSHPITEEMRIPEVDEEPATAAPRPRASTRTVSKPEERARSLTRGEVKAALPQEPPASRARTPVRTSTRTEEPAAPRMRVPSRSDVKAPAAPEEEHEDVPTAIIRPRSLPGPPGPGPESGESLVPPVQETPEVPTAIIRPRSLPLPGLEPALEPHHSELPTARTAPLPASEQFSEEVTNVRPWQGPPPVFSQLNEDPEDLTRPIRPLAGTHRVYPPPPPLVLTEPQPEPPASVPFGAEPFDVEPQADAPPATDDSTLPGLAPVAPLGDTSHGSRRSWLLVAVFLSVLTVCAVVLVMFLEDRRTTPAVLPPPPPPSAQTTVTSPPQEAPPAPEASPAPEEEVTDPPAAAEPAPEQSPLPTLQAGELVELRTASSAAPAQAPGTLTLITRPYAKVFLESRTLGDTPLFQVSLPAGSHNLHLIGPDKTPRVLPVVIEPGKDTRLQLPLSELPGK
jgi:serine/threonine protein kinase